MPKFVVSQHHRCIVDYVVEADNEEEAVYLLLTGEGWQQNAIEESDYHPNVWGEDKEVGLSAEQNQGLYNYLRNRGVKLHEGHIDSLAGVEPLKTEEN